MSKPLPLAMKVKTTCARVPFVDCQRATWTLLAVSRRDERTRQESRALNSRRPSALYRHTKILVAALNGPAIGLSAALLGHFDFCYAMDNFVSRSSDSDRDLADARARQYLLTPFTTLSLGE